MHAVWQVVKIQDTDLSDTDREKWLDSGMPDLATWGGRPYKVDVEWVAGADPHWVADGQRGTTGVLNVPADTWMHWNVYLTGRWPQCSCCGEPMPCRAELEDEQVTASLDRVAHLEAIPPGACWSCAEPITCRQKSVTYPGDNLDLPGARPATFHTRSKCSASAHQYEQRWVAADPRRERILTWPRCDGILVVHGDGTSECASGPTPLGGIAESQPDCRGHLTHDHGSVRACYVQHDYFRPGDWDRCPRGCSRENHPGTRATPRPERRRPSAEQPTLEAN